MKPSHFLYKSDGLYYMPWLPTEPNYISYGESGEKKDNPNFGIAYEIYEHALKRAKEEVIKVDDESSVIIESRIVMSLPAGKHSLKEGEIYTINIEEKIEVVEEDTVEDGGGCYVAGSRRFARIAAPKKEDESENGISLIAKERIEQLTKHGRSVYLDFLQNSDCQLSDAASKLCADDIGGYWETKLLPNGWDQAIWDRMTNKSYKERIIIAGALIAAEIDRIIFIENDDKIKRKPTMTPQEAAEQYANKVVGEYSSNDDEYFKWNTAREDFLAGQKWQSEQDNKAKWIKSADQLPSHNKSVLVFIPEEDNHITAGMYDASSKWILLDEYRQPKSQVTYWREMPAEPDDKTYEKSFVHTDDIETMPGNNQNVKQKIV